MILELDALLFVYFFNSLFYFFIASQNHKQKGIPITGSTSSVNVGGEGREKKKNEISEIKHKQ